MRANRAVNHFGRDAGDVFKNGKWWVAERDSGTPARRTLGRFKNRGNAQAALLLDAQAKFDASPEGKAAYARRDADLARFGERIRKVLFVEPTLDGVSYAQLEARTVAQREALRQRMATANYGSITAAHGEAKGTLADIAAKVQSSGHPFKVKRGRGGR